MFSTINKAADIASNALLDAKESAKAQVNEERDLAIASGVAYDGHTFQSNKQSIDDLTAVSTLSLINDGIVVPWFTADNVVVNLDATDIQTLAGLFAQHKTTHVVAARTKKDAIESATTIAEVETALNS